MLSPSDALRHWPARGPVQEAPDSGLINRTYVAGDPVAHVLQWVNPIFDPSIHLDIAAVTERLDATGLATPRLVPTRTGALWLDDDPGCWRLWTYMPGRTIHRLSSSEQAASAGALVGRFHRALSDWRHEFRSPPRRIHDTPARMAELVEALDAAGDHPLAEAARRAGREILQGWRSWDGETDLPERPCHGDLKISNLRFSEDGCRALCLLDLDTLEPMPLASELGDAWRSWCNPATEDDAARTTLDLELFTSSARAWFAHGPDLDQRERASLVPGVERICLELAARFCADAVDNCYFAEDRTRFPAAGEHNLQRSMCQLGLARAWRQRRAECERILKRIS